MELCSPQPVKGRTMLIDFDPPCPSRDGGRRDGQVGLSGAGPADQRRGRYVAVPERPSGRERLPLVLPVL